MEILLQHLRAQYGLLFPTLCDDHPDIFPRELYTWEQFLWACELWYSNGMNVMFPDGKLRTCLIPIAGFLNHSVWHFFILLPFNFRFAYMFSASLVKMNFRLSMIVVYATEVQR